MATLAKGEARLSSIHSNIVSESPARELPLDLDAVDDEVDRLNEHHEAMHSRGALADIAINTGAIYIGVFSLVTVHTTLSALSSTAAVALLGIPIIAGAATTGFMRWKAKRFGHLTDADKLSQKIQRELKRYDTRGWVRRTIANGIGLGVVVGVPFGIVAAALNALPEAAAGNRLLAIPIIAGATCLCTIPLALFFRWASVKYHRKFVEPSHLTSAE